MCLPLELVDGVDFSNVIWKRWRDSEWFEVLLPAAENGGDKSQGHYLEGNAVAISFFQIIAIYDTSRELFLFFGPTMNIFRLESWNTVSKYGSFYLEEVTIVTQLSYAGTQLRYKLYKINNVYQTDY